MNPEPRLLVAIFVASILASASALAAPSAASVIQLSPPTRPAAAAIAAPQPSVAFAIPRYVLSEAERDIVAACLVLESASQGEFGMRGVMAVIRNRARGMPELFAPTVLRPKQFSAFNKATAGRERISQLVARAKKDRTWSTALAVLDDALTDRWYDPTGGATHYTLTGERTRWTHRLAMTVRIGAHSFYR